MAGSPLRTLLLSQADIVRLLDVDQLVEALAEGFKALSADPKVMAPPRGELVTDEGGVVLTMPAFMPGRHMSTKLVSVFPQNAGTDIPSHLGLIVLQDAKTGATLALMDGSHITAMRTAGASVLAAKLLARPDARTMTIIGAGVQGAAHLDLMTRHFDIETINIVSRNPESAAALAARHPRAVVTGDAERAVRASDIVCLCTHAHQPQILADWVRPGQHISSVGYAPPAGELDPAIPARHKLYVEAKIALAPPPAGCGELAGIAPDRACELGELLLGLKPGRESADDITVYKAMGHAIEDLVAADMVYRNALRQSAGTYFEL